MKYFLLFACLLAVASCNTKQSNEKAAPDAMPATAEADTATTKNEAHFFWFSEYEPKGLIMIKTRQLPEDSVSNENIIKLMNEMYPEIKVQLDKVSNDTVFVSIPNSTYLTQQTGSSGPESYIAELTYNLTETKNVNYVSLQFKKGDHAQPGTFSRANFKQAQ
jgi:hypothetical protein